MKMIVSPLTVIACDAALAALCINEEGEGFIDKPLPQPLCIGVPQTRKVTPPGYTNGQPGRMTMSSFARRPLAQAVGAGVLLLCLLASCGSLAQTPVAGASTSPNPAAATSLTPTAQTKTTIVAATKPTLVAPAKPDTTKPLTTGSDPAAASIEAYLTRVRLDNKAVQASPGAIWTDAGRLTRMSTDVRAMRPHDLISVVVSESLAASTDGTVKNSRASNANSSISGLIGTLHAGNALQNLITQTSSAGLNAQGASATNSSLTTTFGGQVVEVLPNGMLVIEAARQVEFSQQTQTIVLRGLVRPEDISQQNQVLSTAISSMELQVRGKGIVNDFTHRQNPLVRFLQWALVF